MAPSSGARGATRHSFRPRTRLPASIKHRPFPHTHLDPEQLLQESRDTLRGANRRILQLACHVVAGQLQAQLHVRQVPAQCVAGVHSAVEHSCRSARSTVPEARGATNQAHLSRETPAGAALHKSLTYATASNLAVVNCSRSAIVTVPVLATDERSPRAPRTTAASCVVDLARHSLR